MPDIFAVSGQLVSLDEAVTVEIMLVPGILVLLEDLGAVLCRLAEFDHVDLQVLGVRDPGLVAVAHVFDHLTRERLPLGSFCPLALRVETEWLRLVLLRISRSRRT